MITGGSASSPGIRPTDRLRILLAVCEHDGRETNPMEVDRYLYKLARLPRRVTAKNAINYVHQWYRHHQNTPLTLDCLMVGLSTPTTNPLPKHLVPRC